MTAVAHPLERIERWRVAGARLAVDGNEIWFRDGGDTGQGEDLLLIHGFPTSSFDWHALWTPLSARFRVVAMDLLGFGFSAKPRDVRYTIAMQADVVEAIAAHLGIERAHLLAHDYGDTVTQELLARAAERRAAAAPGLAIASVCLLNGGLFPETHRARFVQRLLASPVGPLIARAVGARGFKRSLAAVFGRSTRPSTAELDEYWAIVRERNGHLVLPRLIAYMAERRAHRARWVGALQTAPMPLRLIDGLDDPVSGRHMVARYRELIPRADVVELAGIGHYPQVEAPQAVLAAVRDIHCRIGLTGIG